MARRRERLAAAGVLGVAALAAILILARPAAPPPRVVKEDAPPAAAAAMLMAAIEIVELSALLPPTPAPAQPEPAPAAPPAPSPPESAPAPPQPVKAETPPPPPPPPPPAPKPMPVAAPVQPLKPTIPAEPPPTKSFTPLKPDAAPQVAEVPTHQPLVPLKVEEQDLERMRQARAEPKEIVPLKPADPPPAPPKVTPMRPAEIKVAAPQPQPQLLIPPQPPETARAEEPPPKPEPPPPAPKPAPPPPAPKPPAVTGGTVGEGRALLRILEKGSGPSIQIGWPGQAGERDRLYRTLVNCFGMRVGLVDEGGRLYLAGGKPGEPSEFDTERYSGFVRRPEGAMAADEQREAARLNAYHHAQAAPVRVFPRHVDAYLISSLRQAVGENYLAVKTVRAAYRLDGGHVIVNAITADGRTVSGTIDLTPVANTCSG